MPQIRLPPSVRRKQQSPLARSVSEWRRPTRLRCADESPLPSRPRYAAIFSISVLLTQTYPGAPVQQLPHWVQENRRPPPYHLPSSDASVIGSVRTVATASPLRLPGGRSLVVLQGLLVLFDDLLVVVTSADDRQREKTEQAQTG